MPRHAAFCVSERPFVVWSDDVTRDNRSFLESIDSGFYFRAAGLLMGSGSSESDTDDDDDQTRKDVSSLARMLWHHGIETLVMLLGAYIQAPHAVHAYFQKCKTEDATWIARTILSGERPVYNKINDVPFTLSNLLMGLHLRAGWPDRDATVNKFEQVLAGILSDFAEEEHRWEYNSIKHGLRATHGRFALMAGPRRHMAFPRRLRLCIRLAIRATPASSRWQGRSRMPRNRLRRSTSTWRK
ncbi:hypothetical protein X747_28735 [Mesorhizobium sp. LNJC384A00]|uniref:hypothetical protein n=1 Tax=Mesorhizobium sp. LNJC384A00 TaxID=1287268 RepID=UPI0003CF8062|nr:hypothetical protein [Mesorhizobium sp. LNJC384A00]ESY35295.1 hypothetical protein X747_28735 [Mesorhizobium sp. LNJC384A00]